MIKGVIGKQAFCLGSREERVITAHKGGVSHLLHEAFLGMRSILFLAKS
jgi:hypothetical protein